ncbi:MAG: PAS domain S-box protein [Anaerolineae bacterium]
MNIFALQSLVAFVMALFLGSYVYSKNPKGKLNRVYLCLCLSYAYLVFIEFEYLTAESFETAYFCQKAGAFWPFAMSISLHFALVLTEQSKLLRNRFTYPLIYVPALIFSLLDLTTNALTREPVKVYWGWTYRIPENSLILYINSIWNLIVLTVPICICLRYYLKVTDYKKKQQAKYVLIGYSIPVVSVIVIDLLLPLLKIRMPGFSTTVFILAGIPTGYGIWKYELFTLTPVTAAEGIISTMSDSLILVGPDKRIRAVNQATLKLLGYEEGKLITQAVEFIFDERAENTTLERTLHKLMGTGFASDVETSFKSKDGRSIPVSLSASLMRDKVGSPLGIILVGRDITERKQAEKALRESEQRFRDMARAAGDWIWEVDAEGRYTYASPVVEQVLGYTPGEVLGRRYTDFFHPDEELKVQTRTVFPRKEPFVRLVSSNVRKDGHTVILESTGLPLLDAEGNLLGYRGVHRDVTAERRLEERLAAVHVLGRELVLCRDEQQVARVVVDAARLLLQCHLCGLWLVGEGKALVRRACKVAQQVSDVTALPLDGEQGIIVAVARSGKPIYLPDVREDSRYIDPGIGTRSELCVPLAVGELVIGVLNAESEKLNAFSKEDRQLFSTLADQAALAIENARLYEQMRVARDRLETLSRRLVEVQEAERRHIARELHDEVGQVLTALKLVLEMNKSLPVAATGDNLDEALGLINELMTRVRELSLDLRPTTLDDLGLLPALRWHFERYTTQTNVRVVFKHAGLEGRRFVPEVETAAYRIVQEALTNVARHAGVSEVTARLWADQDTLGVQIEDQGTGFDVESALAAGTSSGLSGMHERAALLSGQLTVESAPGAGTRLTAEFPLTAHPAESLDEPDEGE